MSQLKQPQQREQQPSQDNDGDKEKYIKPTNIEIQLSKEKRQMCRDIVKEINNFGVSQRQKLFICELLALELEDREIGVAFNDAVKLARSKLKDDIIVETAPKKKLII